MVGNEKVQSGRVVVVVVVVAGEIERQRDFSHTNIATFFCSFEICIVEQIVLGHL